MMSILAPVIFWNAEDKISLKLHWNIIIIYLLPPLSRTGNFPVLVGVDSTEVLYPHVDFVGLGGGKSNVGFRFWCWRGFGQANSLPNLFHVH